MMGRERERAPRHIYDNQFTRQSKINPNRVSCMIHIVCFGYQMNRQIVVIVDAYDRCLSIRVTCEIFCLWFEWERHAVIDWKWMNLHKRMIKWALTAWDLIQCDMNIIHHSFKCDLTCFWEWEIENEENRIEKREGILIILTVQAGMTTINDYDRRYFFDGKRCSYQRQTISPFAYAMGSSPKCAYSSLLIFQSS